MILPLHNYLVPSFSGHHSIASVKAYFCIQGYRIYTTKGCAAGQGL